jgi:hypothetical protein
VEGRDGVVAFLSKYLSRFVVYLIYNKHRFLPSNFVQIQESSDMRITYRFLLDSLQFRLRFIEQNASLGVDLLSIDFRSSVVVDMVLDGNATSFPMFVDVPFLDLVIQSNVGKSFAETRGHSKSEVVPVASLKFLLKDLERTYTKAPLAAARYWNNKNSKDEARYKKLRDIQRESEHDAGEIEHDAGASEIFTESESEALDSETFSDTESSVSMMDIDRESVTQNPNPLDVEAPPEVWKSFTDSEVESNADAYNKIFLELVEQERSRDVVKHKMDFITL